METLNFLSLLMLLLCAFQVQAGLSESFTTRYFDGMNFYDDAWNLYGGLDNSKHAFIHWCATRTVKGASGLTHKLACSQSRRSKKVPTYILDSTFYCSK
jgi:hypothetical protein